MIVCTQVHQGVEMLTKKCQRSNRPQLRKFQVLCSLNNINIFHVCCLCDFFCLSNFSLSLLLRWGWWGRQIFSSTFTSYFTLLSDYFELKKTNLQIPHQQWSPLCYHLATCQSIEQCHIHCHCHWATSPGAQCAVSHLSSTCLGRQRNFVLHELVGFSASPLVPSSLCVVDRIQHCEGVWRSSDASGTHHHMFPHPCFPANTKFIW